MSGRRGVLLEIAGCDVGFSANETAKALSCASWSTSIQEAIRSVPNSQSMGVDPFSGDFSNGGTEIELTKEAGILLVRSTQPITTLRADVSKTDLFLTVTDTTAFPASGTVWVGSEAVTYTATTPTTFAPAVRGALGTTEQAHTATLGTAKVSTPVYGFNPNILGRLAKVSWYDLDQASPVPALKFHGVVDDFDFGGNCFVLRLISGAKRFIDAEAMTGKFATGTFRGAYFPSYSGELKGLPAPTEKGANSTNSVVVDLKDKDVRFPLASDLGIPWQLMFYRIGDELFGYSSNTTPGGIVGPLGYIGTDPLYGRYFTTDGFFLSSDMIRWNTPGSSSFTYAQITRIFNAPSASGQALMIYHNANSDPSPGDVLSCAGRQKFSPLFRGRASTPQTRHDIGEEVSEVRMIHGNMVAVALRLMLSRDGNNSIYDNLPSEWGAGIDAAFVDLPSFQALIPETPTNTYFFDGPVQIKPLLMNIARLTGARIYVNTNGILTARFEREVWPDNQAVGDVTVDLLEQGSIPQWNPQMGNIFNAWTFKGNAVRGGDFLDQAHFEEPVSVYRYGRRPLDDYEDKHIHLSRDAATLEILAYTVMLRWSTPNPIVDLVLLVDDSLIPWEPGQIIYLDLPHLPDFSGGAGISTMSELLEWSPNDMSGTVAVRVALMPPLGEVRLVSPAAEVQSVAGAVLTMEQSITTHLSNPLGKTGVPVLSRPGTEDVDYFETNLPVQVVDRSNPANKHSTTIASIDYGLREITLASLPAWTIAVGDVVRLDTFANVEAFNPTWTYTYTWLSKNHVWGR